MNRLLLAFAFGLLPLAESVRAQAPATAQGDGIETRVERRGDVVVIDVEAEVAVPPAVAWQVLTDYERMPGYLSSLTSSHVLARQGNVIDVAQAGQTRVLFMTFAFAAVRRIELVAEREIRSSLVSGDFKSYSATTRIVDAGGKTCLVHHGEYEPKRWIPPMIGPSVIASETRRQYGEMFAEMLRRHAAR